MAVVTVIEADGVTQTDVTISEPGRAAAAASKPITFSTEDFQAVGATNETAPGSDTAAAGLNGRLQRIAQNITSAITHLATLAGAISSSRMAVNVIPGQAGVAAGSGASGTTTQRVVHASDDPSVVVLGATSGAGVITNANGTIQQYLRGLVTQWVAGTLVIGTGSNTIGDVVSTQRATTNGLTSSRVASAASTNATSLKASAGRIARIDLFNNSAATKYFKLYNKASAPTVGTDTPIWTVPLPAGTGYSGDFKFGKYFSTGIAYAITGALVDTDTTALALNDVHGSIDWI